MTISPLSTAVHAIGAAVFGYSLYYDLLYVHAPPHLLEKYKNFEFAARWPGKWKFLTVWNLVIQLVYHTVALLNDVFGSADLNKNRQTFLQKLRDAYFASWVFPTGMFVCAVFWGLQFMDTELIGMPSTDVIPQWLNHILHTVPVVFLLFESVFLPRSRQNSVLTCGTLIVGAFVYIGWIVWIYHITHVWPYPVLSILEPLHRAIFITASGVIILLFYFLGEALNKWRWGTEIAVSEKRKKKK